MKGIEQEYISQERPIVLLVSIFFFHLYSHPQVILVFCNTLGNCVPDPWNFCTGSDPRIRTSDKWIRFLFFSSVTFKTPTKNIIICFFCFLLYEGTLHLHHSSKIKKLQNSRNQGFSSYFCWVMKWFVSVYLTNGSGRPKNLRILWLWNTACQGLRLHVHPGHVHPPPSPVWKKCKFVYLRLDNFLPRIIIYKKQSFNF